MKTHFRDTVTDLAGHAETTTDDVGRPAMSPRSDPRSATPEMPLWRHLRPALVATAVAVVLVAAIAGLTYSFTPKVTGVDPAPYSMVVIPSLQASGHPITATPMDPSLSR